MRGQIMLNKKYGYNNETVYIKSPEGLKNVLNKALEELDYLDKNGINLKTKEHLYEIDKCLLWALYSTRKNIENIALSCVDYDNETIKESIFESYKEFFDYEEYSKHYSYATPEKYHKEVKRILKENEINTAIKVDVKDDVLIVKTPYLFKKYSSSKHITYNHFMANLVGLELQKYLNLHNKTDLFNNKYELKNKKYTLIVVRKKTGKYSVNTTCDNDNLEVSPIINVIRQALKISDGADKMDHVVKYITCEKKEDEGTYFYLLTTEKYEDNPKIIYML